MDLTQEQLKSIIKEVIKAMKGDFYAEVHKYRPKVIKNKPKKNKILKNKIRKPKKLREEDVGHGLRQYSCGHSGNCRCSTKIRELGGHDVREINIPCPMCREI